jgi:hypothetical protein
MEIFLISYLFQIPLALYAAFKLPRPAGLGEKTQRLRTLAITFGVLPCGPLSVILQVAYILMYHAAVKVKVAQGARHERAFRAAAGGTPTPSGTNPFGGSSTPKPAASERNPFGAGPPPAGHSSAANPFADSRGTVPGEDEKRPDNPFA